MLDENISKWYQKLGKKSWQKHPHSPEHMKELQRKSVLARKKNKLSTVKI